MIYIRCVRPVWRVNIPEWNINGLSKGCKSLVSASWRTAGVDGMSVKELPAHLKLRRDEIVKAIRTGSYIAQPILGVEIPKEDGTQRLLGVPSVVDRLFQQAAHQVINLKFEPEFKDHSYGFRPGRNSHQAVQQAQKNIHEGYDYIVDIDLKSFFDEVDHGILLQLLYSKVKCPITLRLLRKWLKAPILINGKLTKRTKGVPQGSPISPLLSTRFGSCAFYYNLKNIGITILMSIGWPFRVPGAHLGLSLITRNASLSIDSNTPSKILTLSDLIVPSLDTTNSTSTCPCFPCFLASFGYLIFEDINFMNPVIPFFGSGAVSKILSSDLFVFKVSLDDCPIR